MGRSRGGLTTKIHALVDANGLPIALKLTEGQAHDGRSAEDMLETVRKGTILLADRAYDSDERRETLSKRGAWANIKPLSNRKTKPAFSAYLYRYRNLVERFFNKAQALPRRRNALRQAGRQLPRVDPTRVAANLASRKMSLWPSPYCFNKRAVGMERAAEIGMGARDGVRVCR